MHRPDAEAGGPPPFLKNVVLLVSSCAMRDYDGGHEEHGKEISCPRIHLSMVSRPDEQEVEMLA